MKSLLVRISLLASLNGSIPALHAESYDTDLLEIYSKILPRLVIMSTQKARIQDNVSLCFLHDIIDTPAANQLSDDITKSLTGPHINYRIEVTQKQFSQAAGCEGSHLVFLFNSDLATVKEALKAIENYTVITAAYDMALLEHGVDVSLHVGRSVVPYLNLKSLKRKGIVFDNILLRVSKIYAESGGRP